MAGPNPIHPRQPRIDPDADTNSTPGNFQELQTKAFQTMTDSLVAIHQEMQNFNSSITAMNDKMTRFGVQSLNPGLGNQNGKASGIIAAAAASNIRPIQQAAQAAQALGVGSGGLKSLDIKKDDYLGNLGKAIQGPQPLREVASRFKHRSWKSRVQPADPADSVAPSSVYHTAHPESRRSDRARARAQRARPVVTPEAPEAPEAPEVEPTVPPTGRPRRKAADGGGNSNYGEYWFGGRDRPPPAEPPPAEPEPEEPTRRQKVRHHVGNATILASRLPVVRNILPKLATPIGGPLTAMGAVAIGGLAAVKAGQNQMDINRKWQNQLGGTNAEQFAQRGHAAWYGLTNKFSQMGSDRSKEAFRAVSAMGITNNTKAAGPSRQDALEFISHNFNSRGMTPEESQRAMQISLQNGQQSLEGLSTALHQVDIAARKAGVGVAGAREKFLQTFQSLSEKGVGGGAAKLAGLYTNAAGGDRTTKDLDYSVQSETNWMARAAAQSGKTLGEIEYMRNEEPNKYTDLVDTVVQQNMSNMLNPRLIEFLKQQVKAVPGGVKKLTQSKKTAIVKAFRKEFKTETFGDTFTAQVKAITGVQAGNGNQAAMLLLNYVIAREDPTQGDTPGAIAKRQAMAASPRGADGKILDGPGKGTTGPEGMEPAEIGTKKTTFEQTKSLAGALTNPMTAVKELTEAVVPDFLPDWVPGARDDGGGRNLSDADKQELKYQKEHGGIVDPIANAILKSTANPDNAKVEVETKEGTRIVSFAEAMKNFRGQVLSGQAKFKGGSKDGETVTSQSGDGSAHDSEDTKAGAAALKAAEEEAARKSDAGQTVDDYDADHEGEEKGTQNVLVGFTDEARQIFKVEDPSNNTGNPPTPPSGKEDR